MVFLFMAKLKLDLHNIYNKGKDIDIALNNIIEEAISCKIRNYRNNSRQRQRTVKKESATFFTTTRNKKVIPQNRKRQQKFWEGICVF